MPRIPTWRVRVYRKVEAWVDVEAWNKEQAELYAANLPGVIQVFRESAVNAIDIKPPRPAGVIDD